MCCRDTQSYVTRHINSAPTPMTPATRQDGVRPSRVLGPPAKPLQLDEANVLERFAHLGLFALIHLQSWFFPLAEPHYIKKRLQTVAICRSSNIKLTLGGRCKELLPLANTNLPSITRFALCVG